LGRVAYFLIVLGVVVAGAFALNLLAEDPGTLTLEFGGRIWHLTLFETAIAVAAMLLAILVAVKIAWFAVALVRFVAGDADAFGSFFARRRERLGLDALSRSMIALAAGDARSAEKNARQAERRLVRPELTGLVRAQAADLVGDGARAETHYKALMSNPRTAFVGTQGLLSRALEGSDDDRALKLALRARELAPKDRATLETLYTLQSRKFDWDAARKTLADQRRAGHVGKVEADRREGALALAQAGDAEDLGEAKRACALAVEAAKLDPTNVEAVSKAVGLLLESQSKRAAGKLVTDAWRVQPHPILAAAFASIEPEESPSERRRRFRMLFDIRPKHEETCFLRAELALVARDWSAARDAIGDLRETEPSARSCTIMAAVARGEGEPDHVVRAWLARALGAPRTTTDSELGRAAMLPLLAGAEEETIGVGAAPDDAGWAREPSEPTARAGRDAEAPGDRSREHKTAT